MLTKTNINVLSLFNGLGSIWIILDRLGVTVNKRYSSEIDKYANIVNNANYPTTIQLGDITKINGDDLDTIDLLVGGSPCQGFSFAGHQLNFDDHRSKLFFEFVRLLKETKPKYFLLENVKMKQEYQDIISKYLGVKPIEIHSSKFVPQNRKRLYWANFEINQPIQQKYDIKDYYNGGGFPSAGVLHKNPRRIEFKKTNIFNTLTATMYKGINASGRPAISIRESFYYDDRTAHRMLTPNETEQLQSIPNDYTNYVSKTQRYKMIGNGWELKTIEFILNGIFNTHENKLNKLFDF